MTDLTGRTFGRWEVVGKGATVGVGRKSRGRWRCKCSCGTESEVDTNNLTAGKSTGCGCARKESLSKIKPAATHGRSNTSEWSMYRGARTRAKERGMDFDLKVTDIVVPDLCPLLSIPLVRGSNGRLNEGSPTLDRIDNSKGYTKDNVWVISHKANSIKSTATYEEIELVARNLKEKILNG